MRNTRKKFEPGDRIIVTSGTALYGAVGEFLSELAGGWSIILVKGFESQVLTSGIAKLPKRGIRL